jgi:hypothetical protein
VATVPSVLRAGLALGAVAVGIGLTALPSQGAAATACSTRNLGIPGGYQLVRVQAVGLSCARARSLARTVASQLHRDGTIEIPGVAGFSMSTQTCTGCGSTTQVSLSYPSGAKVTLSLKDARPASAPTPGATPAPLPLPSPGPGPLTI